MTSDAEAATSTDEAYDRLLERVRRLTHVESARGVLSWDQQVTMPEGGTPARSKQLSALSTVHHDLLTDPELGDLLEEVDGPDSEGSAPDGEGTALDGERAAVVREVRRDHDRATAVPRDLVEALSEASTEALGAWERAKAEDDFDAFAPHLERLVDLNREYAAHVDPDRDPYAVLLEEYEPCLSMDRVEAVLSDLRETLVPLVARVRESDADLTTDAFVGGGRSYDEATQEALSREALELLGFDFERGRFDTSAHPFTSGNQFDCRVTTRFDETDPLGALTATVHEFGHAQYNLGLPQEAFGTPLGEPRDLSVHESQSRLWENHVGRSQPFWELFLPRFVERFPQAEGVTPREAYESANQVYEDNPIRIEADELTYHMHILVRFEIERDLIAGDLDVAEVPAVWNETMDEYLGVVPESDAEGCLQDIHWSHGSFGYFPTYSLGSAMAAQLFAAFEDDYDGDVDADVAAGEFGPLREWLADNVHRHGSRYETNDLVERATGEPFAADAFLDYATEKYGDLYDVEVDDL